MKKKIVYSEPDCGGIQPKPLTVKAKYIEPADYFPKELRKKYKLGEYAESKELIMIKSVILGHAVGDALGVPVEFCDRKKLEEKPVSKMLGYGTYKVPAGSWSDDTSMSLAALDSLAKGKLDLFDIMLNFVKWLENGEYTPTGKSFDVGRTCLNAIRNFHRNCYTNAGEYILPSDFDITECGEKGELSNGNGSLMRINPFILWARFKSGERVDIEELVEQASKITHAHERSVLACKIYAILMYYLIAEQSRGSLLFALDDIYCRYCDEKEYSHFARIFDENFANLTVDEIKSTGYVVDSLEAAIWCLLNTDNYKDCVLKAVNLGGDTDTIAAIAGGLAGLMYGYESIPEEWLDTLIKREEIEELCERAERVWRAI